MVNHILGRRLRMLPALWEASWAHVGIQSLCSTAIDEARAAREAATTASSAAVTDLRPGAVLTASRCFCAEDVAAFTALTGDSNPIHTSSTAAAAAGLPGMLLPGLLLASLFPAIIGTHFPGALYLTQTLKFKRHALVGDAVTAQLTVERCSGSRVTFQTLCLSSASGETLVEGTALALIRPGKAATAAARGSALSGRSAATGQQNGDL